jgi:hypothetical protein
MGKGFAGVSTRRRDVVAVVPHIARRLLFDIGFTAPVENGHARDVAQMTSLRAWSSAGTGIRVWQQQRAQACGIALVGVVAYGLASAFGGIVERITTEVPTTCPSAGLDNHTRLAASAVSTDGYLTQQTGTNNLLRHPVDRHDEPVPAAAGGELHAMEPELSRVGCGAAMAAPAPNQPGTTGPW